MKWLSVIVVALSTRRLLANDGVHNTVHPLLVSNGIVPFRCRLTSVMDNRRVVVEIDHLAGEATFALQVKHRCLGKHDQHAEAQKNGVHFLLN